MHLRHALRRFVREPRFTATALLTLALCLGANFTVFAVIDAILLRPLPFPASDQLVTIFNTYPKAGVEDDGSSVANYYERRGRIAAFSGIAIYREGTAIIGPAGATEREAITRVSPDFFATLGAGPAIGRTFTDAETTPDTGNVAILTDAYWRQQFNADPEVLGRAIRVNGQPHEVVGVLPPAFRWLSSTARLYVPLSSSDAARGPAQRHSGSTTEMIGRLAPGATVAQAQSEVDAHDAALADTYPQATLIADAGFRSVVVSLRDDHVAAVRPTLLLVQASVLFLLLIGGVNLVNLLLVRASGHARDVAIRQSMGASRRQVITGVLVDTLLLMLLGGLLGIATGASGIRLLTLLGADQLPLGAHIAFDARLAAIGLAAAFVMGLAVAVPIAWFTIGGQLAAMLQSESRGGTINRSAQRVRHAFIVAQIALAVVLLAGAGLLGLSLTRAMAVSPGFRADHALTGQIALPWNTYDTDAARLTFAERLIEAVGHQPGVVSAGAVTNVPLSGNRVKSAVTVKGFVVRPGGSVRGHYTYGVAGDYFAALGIPLLEGRFLSTADSHRAGRTCVIDEDFARRYFAGGGAIGRQIIQGSRGGGDADACTIVGVVGAVKQAELTDDQAQGAVYFPYRDRGGDDLFVVARTSRAPESLTATLRTVVRDLDPELPVENIRSMDVRIADSLVTRRSPAVLTAIFAAVALLLAAIGTYGVLSYAVQQRRREIGVRMALGAGPDQIRRQFLSLGLRLLAAGTTLGLIGAWMSGRAMHTILFDVPPVHVATLAGAAGIMSAITLVACLLPSQSAARISPMEVMGEK